MGQTEFNVKSMTLRTFLIPLATLSLLALSGTVHAQTLPPGTPDPAFGIGGHATTDFHGYDDQMFALAPLRDGRFLAAGVTFNTNAAGFSNSENMAIARYDADGLLDTSFGAGGLVNLDLDGASDDARAIKVLSDGGILVAGTLSTNAHADFGLVKLHANGSLDHSFGEGSGNLRSGYVRLNIGGSTVDDHGYAVAVQSDGRIVLAGTTRVPHSSSLSYTQVAVARLNANGDVDTSFGGSGTGYTILAPFWGDADDLLTGIALDPAGNLPANNLITLVGYTYARNNVFIARLTANGGVDTSFGDTVGSVHSGHILLHAAHSAGNYSGVSYLGAARITADGHIVIAGQGNDDGITLMRFLGNGSLDTSFATAGRVTIKFSAASDSDRPDALAIQGNGKLVASGYATNRATGTPHKDFYVVRALANGTVDTSFGDGHGRVVVAVSNQDDGSFATAVEPSGNLLVGGYAQIGSPQQQRDFALLHLIGDPDRIFADGFDAPM